MTPPSLFRQFDQAAFEEGSGAVTPSSGAPFSTARHREHTKHPPPFSIRFTKEERAKLEHAAGALSLAAYIRLQLFAKDGQSTSKRMKTRKRPSPSFEMEVIGKLLAKLGQSRLASNLNQIAKAAHIGALPVTEDLETELQEACAHVKDIRLLLIQSMGVKAHDTER